MLLHIHHVQLAMPIGGEDRARAFYGDLLGIAEQEKPDAMKNRGGCWFEQNGLRVHLGVEQDFKPARKAHPGFQTARFDDLRAKIMAAGHVVANGDVVANGNKLDRCRRFFVDDPFGNRIEILDMAG